MTLRQRAPRVRDSAYLAWLHTCPCLPCVIAGVRRRDIQAAHVRMGDIEAGWRGAGMAEKPDDRRCVPLCGSHHQDGGRTQNGQHGSNEREWWKRQRVDVFQFVADLNEAFDLGRPGAFVVAKHAALARMGT